MQMRTSWAGREYRPLAGWPVNLVTCATGPPSIVGGSQRFELEYTAQDGTRQTPIVIHRAIFGSIERLVGVIVEHFAGAFPVWLAPVQAVVLPISDEKHLEYATEVAARLRRAGVRVDVAQYESLNSRIRQAEKQKVPYILVVGEREQEQGTAAVRRHKVKEQRVLPVEDVVMEIATRCAGASWTCTWRRSPRASWSPAARRRRRILAEVRECVSALVR
jgi:Anticodon binding domain